MVVRIFVGMDTGPSPCLFCLIHHHYLHDKGWEARIGPDGRVEVVPPPWVDPAQKPRRNHHWLKPKDFKDFTTDPDP